ncbi:MAG: hypothetical protein RIR41_1300 [Pseudomonadota bacterium]|jgi:hypothetical protein
MPASRTRGPSAHHTGPSPSHTRVGVQANSSPVGTTGTASSNNAPIIRRLLRHRHGRDLHDNRVHLPLWEQRQRLGQQHSWGSKHCQCSTAEVVALHAQAPCGSDSLRSFGRCYTLQRSGRRNELRQMMTPLKLLTITGLRRRSAAVSSVLLREPLISFFPPRASCSSSDYLRQLAA